MKRYKWKPKTQQCFQTTNKLPMFCETKYLFFYKNTFYLLYENELGIYENKYLLMISKRMLLQMTQR